MFSKKVKNACPICTKGMKTRNGRLICPSCGYSIFPHDYEKADCNCFSSEAPTLHQNHPGSHTSAQSRPVQAKPAQTRATQTKAAQQKTTSARQTQTYRSASAQTRNTQSRTSQSKKATKKSSPAAKLVLFFAIFVAVVIRFIPALLNFADLSDRPVSVSPQPETFSFNYQDLVDNNEELIENLEKSKEAMEILENTAAFYLPQSDMFRRLLSEIYQKDCMNISKAEVEAITSLELAYDENYYRTITYTLATGETDTLYFDDTTVTTSDLKRFKGLENLYADGCTLEEGDLDGLDKLRSLHCEDIRLTELAEIINPEQLTSLSYECGIFNDNLIGIGIFTNLNELSIQGYYSFEDISPISELKNLKKLSITYGDEITSFAALYKMPQLTSLSIESNSLRDIGFLSYMTELEELSLSNTELLDISILSECADTVTKLHLTDNYQVEDYSIISAFTNLTDLSLSVYSYSFDQILELPELGNMPNLRTLYINGFTDLSNLADASGLEELIIDCYYGTDMSALAALTNLKRLVFFNVSCEVSEIEPIRQLTALEEIRLESTYIWGNAEWFLNLPALKSFYANEYSAFGFDIANLEINENLESLTLNGTSLRALENGKWDYTVYDENEIHLDEHTDIFANYPNLKTLSLHDNTLSDISFAENLTSLQVLDITDNYVTSLAPLSELPELHTVICPTNPIADDGGLGDKIVVEP